MEQKDKPGKYFGPVPAEYAHLEEWADETTLSLVAIDRAIAEMPKDKGPTYELKPTWADEPPQLSREQKIKNLLNSQRNVVTEFHRRMDDALINAKPEMARSVKATLSYRIDPDNRYKDHTPDELTAAKSQPKSLDQSQDILLTDLYNKQIGFEEAEVLPIAPVKDSQIEISTAKEITLAEFYANKYDIEAFDDFNNGDDKSVDMDKD